MGADGSLTGSSSQGGVFMKSAARLDIRNAASRLLGSACLLLAAAACRDNVLSPSFGLAPNVAASATSGTGAVGLVGRGTTGPGGLDLFMAAIATPNGSAHGESRLRGGATGHVIQVVPPAGARNFWCINIRRTDVGPAFGDQRINWYIRDVGDGSATFDQISFVTSIGGDCLTFPGPPSVFLTLTQGNFKALP